MNVGFYTTDERISSSHNYSDQNFVVDSDNIEFYICTKNNKGKTAQSDDYAILINPEGFTEMRTGNGIQWGRWSGIVDYGVSVDGTINDDSDIDVGWGVEMFLPYQSFGFGKDDKIAIAFGARNKDTNIAKSDWYGWIPDPQIIDTYVTVSREGIELPNTGDLASNNGGWYYDEENDIYSSTSKAALGTFKETKLKAAKTGTYSVDINLGNIEGDSGITFAVKGNDSGLYWENKGVHYYFWFINVDGYAILGEINGDLDHPYIDHQGVALSRDALKNCWVNLKVVLTDNTIYGFVNNSLVKEEYIGPDMYGDLNVGLRADAPGVQYKNVMTSESTDISENITKIDGFETVQGEFKYVDDTKKAVYSDKASSMMVSEKSIYYNCTITCDVTATSLSDNGLVFRLTDNGTSKYWEDPGVSYYHFFLSADNTAYLGAVNYSGQVWKEIKVVPLNDYNYEEKHTLKVELNENNIKCYVDGELLISVTDSALSGGRYGVRSRGVNTQFSIPEVA